MKILVTGSNGLLGQKIVYACLDKYHAKVELIATARGENRLLQKQGYEYVPLDITSKTDVLEVISRFKPDVVIHTAAMTNVDACETDRTGCKANNVDAVSNIVEACNLTGAHLVHVSTDFIFDGENGPYDEEAQANPVSYYGWSKAEAENIIQQSSHSWAILRTILVFGVVDNASRSNVVLWAKSALEKGSPIKVVDDQYRMPTLAEDLAEGCLLAATQKAKGIFNISGKEYMNIYELVHRVAKYFNLDTSMVERSDSSTLNQPAKRPPRTGFTLNKSKSVLGYEPHSFEEGLAVVEKQLAKWKS
jgi:dTDP-4-dehydrorhamnose reductase